MKRTALQIIILLAIFPFAALYARNKGVKSGAIPVWVTQNPVDYLAKSLDDEATDGYVDIAYEKQVSLIQSSSYYKNSLRILSEAGVQNGSEISVSFDPSYQEICFHSIRIIRGSSIIDKLQVSKIKTVQQETELDRFIYNGSLTAVLILEDVRKGDVIEYSYTVKGMNPIFNGKYTDMFDTQFDVPIYQLYYKLICPDNKSVVIRNSHATISPKVTETQSGVIYEWKLDKVPALHDEDHLPSWYDPYPMIMVSEYKSWKEVNDWALSLFSFQTPLASALQKQVSEIQKKCTTPESQILSALRFVQDEVRYMGIEMGVNSHKPHNPAQVLTQRFGDCKDKSYLLCTLLLAMGIEANPVLINTSYKKSISNWLPSFRAFDHATVRVALNGSFYYLDPTISYQRGRLQDISFPDYQIGLVITDTTTGLSTIPLQDKGEVKTKEVFHISDMRGEVKLIVTTKYSGSFADNMRSSFQNNSIYEKRKSFQDFYSNYYKKIKADSLTYEDNEQEGTFTTTERYTIDDFWLLSDGVKKASLHPFILNGVVVRKLNDRERTMPFYLMFPAQYEEEIEINLPETWSINSESENITGPGFELSYDYSCDGNRVTLLYDYKSLKDHVTPEETSEYLAAMKNADESLGFDLSYSPEGKMIPVTATKASGNKYTSLYIILALCLIITFLARRGRNL